MKSEAVNARRHASFDFHQRFSLHCRRTLACRVQVGSATSLPFSMSAPCWHFVPPCLPSPPHPGISLCRPTLAAGLCGVATPSLMPHTFGDGHHSSPRRCLRDVIRLEAACQPGGAQCVGRDPRVCRAPSLQPNTPRTWLCLPRGARSLTRGADGRGLKAPA
jgi:hypothetical protein